MADFMVIGTNEIPKMEVILGRPFLATTTAKLDFENNLTTLRVNGAELVLPMENKKT